ncbi:alpha-1,4-glucan--maltose-1-phosphate maltosyltransferase [Isoptericola dokdonensis]|uniref:Alpha-1,4-glucan:maltose-1-phosphate maltosyltransferase n=1 Tax=Isoptericola dokdonensis DS-3 TaxID=1300344 RepID=A0A168G2Q8_9MICO|nr:alpha-1,4-glucan--maltose-1-phosphate maltosyltransferase [Isoptericola dokdonensis]ANC32986.1 Alpha-1,4-glucan:maltose-1-phosphate maltosyltransferase 2 [Isoptericola dokdonensis DS-3]
MTSPQPTPYRPIGRIPVLEVSPVVEGGRWPAKATPGEVVPVEATVFREGHDAVNATAVLFGPDRRVHSWAPMDDVAPGLDRFRGFLQPDAEGDWSFRVEAWSDPYATWAHDASIKVPAGQDVELMLTEGARLFVEIITQRLQKRRSRADAELLAQVAAELADTTRPPEARLAMATQQAVREALRRIPLRQQMTPSATYPLRVHRRLALAGSWYEMFPRSEGATQRRDGTWRSGTFVSAAKRLPAIAAMGFDVVYLTPIHPIGTTFRKGRNNTLDAQPGDPGSPYAIGSPEGGHDAIHPDLGTERGFKAFVAEAHANGLEVALDLALQCSPDHPWVTEHPEWFTVRADGTIAYAENPPKKYQDIYPLNFDRDPQGIYAEVLRVVRVWIDRGVTLFRVDNPHTKPLDFWEWLLAQVHATNPEVIFLSEAFTKPAMMQTLARIGFHQSYTYFTWRNTKEEVEEYLAEVGGEQGAVMRPSFWPTTHDILPPYLQAGGVAGFAVRAVLAATGSPTWGIYSGYELVENVPRPGVEEQIDNEKYEYKPRDWSRADDLGIAMLLGRLNEVRRAHPALQQLRNITVHTTTNDQVVAFSRRVRAEHLPAAGRPGATQDDVVLVVVNLDPHQAQESTLLLDLEALGLARPDGTEDQPFFAVHDELSGQTFGWGAHPYVRLDPQQQVAHVLRVDPA